MKKTLRGIGMGLFLAGATFTMIQQFDEPISQEKTSTYEKQIKDLEQQLAKAQEQLTNTETPSAVANTPEEEQETTNNTTKQQVTEPIDNTEPSSEENAVHGTILIYEGVTPYDIGKQVEDAGIVENGRELELYLSKPEYARSLQIGQFELHSTMTLEQMAKTLTGKKVD